MNPRAISVALFASALAAQGTSNERPLAVDGKDALAAVDVETRRVKLTIESPDELRPIERLVHLQHLEVRTKASTGRAGSFGSGWREAGADALLPLRSCRALRSLSIGYFQDFDSACLHVLGELPLLDELQLMGAQHVIDRALVSELAKLGLRRLTLTAPRVMPDAFPALCELPLLEQLRLELPLHIDRCDLKSLSRLRNVRRLELRNVGSRLADSMQRTQPLPGDPPRGAVERQQIQRTGLVDGEERVVLGEDAMRALASLPLLQELDLGASVVSDSLMSTLPTKLARLELISVEGLTPTGVASLARLANLRGLAVDAGAPSSALAKVLPSLPLTDLDLVTGVDAELCAGLAKCRTLRAVSIRAGKGEGLEFDFLAELPSLTRVELAGLAVTRANYVRHLLGDDVEVVTR